MELVLKRARCIPRPVLFKVGQHYFGMVECRDRASMSRLCRLAFLSQTKRLISHLLQAAFHPGHGVRRRILVHGVAALVTPLAHIPIETLD